MNKKEVKDRLAALGYTDVPRGIISGFTEYLNEQSTKTEESKKPSDDEDVYWLRRQNARRARMEMIEKQFDEAEQGYKRRKKGKKNRGPYPELTEDEKHSGFIRPKPLSAWRHRFPIYKNEVCYPPVNNKILRKQYPHHLDSPELEHRFDQEMWELRMRMIYSHPDYKRENWVKKGKKR